MKSLRPSRVVFASVLTISLVAAGLGTQSSLAAPKKKSAQPTKPKVKTDLRLFNMCEVMDAIQIADLYPGKVLQPIYFLNEGITGQPIEGAWRQRDLNDEATFVTTWCYRVAGPVEHPEVRSDQLSIGQDRPIAPAKEKQARFKAEAVKSNIDGVDGQAWISRDLIPYNSGRGYQAGCSIFVETKLGSFQVTNGVDVNSAPTITVDQVSCDLVTEVLKRSLAKIATGTVSKLPAPKK
jgi:hypothetical protein